MISGNAEFSADAVYLGKASLILQGSGGGTILQYEFTSDTNRIIQTELYMLPEVATGDDISVNLNGVVLSFTNKEQNKLGVLP